MTDNKEAKLGVSLSDIQRSKPSEKSLGSSSEIEAYAHDMGRSLLIGGIAIAIEIGIYFSGLIK